jgi:putative ABC transport system permease protein
MRIFVFLFKESFVFAFNSLVNNKLRTFLSLFGITIGIFSIISVFTVIDSLEDNIRESIASLGDDVVYVQKWPWVMGDSEYPWWKYMMRPVPSLREARELAEKSKLAEAVAFQVFASKNLQYKDNYAENIEIEAVTDAYKNIRVFDIAKGRYFSDYEMQKGSNKIIMGAKIAEELFIAEDPIGKEIKVMGRKLEIIGVFAKEGEDMFGISKDERIIMPLQYMRNIVNIKSEQLGPMILVKPKAGVSVDELIDELRGLMRSIRRLHPLEEDDFALNKTSIISQGFDGLFMVLDIAGMIIGGFSILVGGFGIANIMFVSVKEQTTIIGIQKAIGAKRYFILLQFLFEAVLLSLIGGTIGLLIIWFATLGVSAATDMTFALSVKNIFIGLSISVTIGIISGLLPAFTASRLDPVKAISQV